MLAGLGALFSGVGAIANTIFSGMNYNSQQQQNEYNKGVNRGQNKFLVDTLLSDGDSYYEKYLNNFNKNKDIIDSLSSDNPRFSFIKDSLKNNLYDSINKQDLFNLMVMDREDTAIQRKVEDAKSSGVNPFYALGGSGSPATSYSSGIQSPSLSAPQFNLVDSFAKLGDILSTVELKNKQADLLDAQKSKVEQETEKISVDTMLSESNLQLSKENLNKVKEEINLIRSNIRVSDAQYDIFMQQVAQYQYDLNKSIELGVRYKDVLNTSSYMLNKLDDLATGFTNSETQKDLLMGLGVALLAHPFLKTGIKVGKWLTPLLKKFGKGVSDKANSLLDTFKKLKKDKSSSKDTNTSDFFG